MFYEIVISKLGSSESDYLSHLAMPMYIPKILHIFILIWGAQQSMIITYLFPLLICSYYSFRPIYFNHLMWLLLWSVGFYLIHACWFFYYHWCCHTEQIYCKIFQLTWGFCSKHLFQLYFWLLEGRNKFTHCLWRTLIYAHFTHTTQIFWIML
jgi:hypothetical protein